MGDLRISSMDKKRSTRAFPSKVDGELRWRLSILINSSKAHLNVWKGLVKEVPNLGRETEKSD